MVFKFRVALALFTLCAGWLAVFPAHLSLVGKFSFGDSAKYLKIPLDWKPSVSSRGFLPEGGPAIVADGHQRGLSMDRAAFVNGLSVPAWRGRFDTIFGRSYFAPATVTNKCDPRDQLCSGLIAGQSFPYEQYILDPTTPTARPVMKVSYPTGAWSTSAAVPGGTLFYAYPYKWDATSAANPFSATGATLEYEVFLPSDFPYVKGEKAVILSILIYWVLTFVFFLF